MPDLKESNRLIQDIYDLKYLLETQVERLGRSMERMTAIERDAWNNGRAFSDTVRRKGAFLSAGRVPAISAAVRRPSLPSA